jgi:hypothetical protein
VPDDSFWEPVSEFLVLIVDVLLAMMIGKWVKVPVIRIAEPLPADAATSASNPIDQAIAEVGTEDVIRLFSHPKVRQALANLVMKSGYNPQEGTESLRSVVGRLASDPSATIARLREMDSGGQKTWVTLCAGWKGPAHTRKIARQIEDALRANRYRGIMPDLGADVFWRRAERRRRIALGAAFLIAMLAIGGMVWRLAF